MKHQRALYALERLHAELGGRILANRKEAKKLAQDMRHVEAVIKMLEPGFNVHGIAARRRLRKNPWFKRGKMFRQAMEILRCAPAPMTAREIVLALLQSRGAPLETNTVRTMFGGIQSSLRNHEGVTVERVGEGMPARWRLKA